MTMEKPKHILLVEDDAKDIELTLGAISKHNLAAEVVVTRDGQEALDYLYRRGQFAKIRPGYPAVILLDLKMPRVDGIQVLKQLKTDPQLCNIPVVILTASGEYRDLKKCYSLGVNAYVVKPVRFKEFIDIVKTIGIFWTLINEPLPILQTVSTLINGKLDR